MMAENKEMPVASDTEFLSREIPLTGKLYTAEDSLTIGENFKVLKNLRYTDANLKGIKGMSKVNTTIPNYVSGISPITSGCGQDIVGMPSNLFVALGDPVVIGLDDYIVTSPDGITWTQ